MSNLNDNASSGRAAVTRSVRSLHGRRVAAVTAGALLLAFGVAVVQRPNYLGLGREDGRLDRLTRNLVAAVGSHRFTEARLVEPFRFDGAPAPVRRQAEPLDPTSQIAALRLIEATGEPSSARALRAAGVAHLVLGETERAIDAFEQAIELDGEDLGARVDLSAALLSRWRAGGQPFDAVRVLEETGTVLTRQPESKEAAFNQALVLEYLGPTEPAIARWREYLERDSSTSWAAEARAHLDALVKATNQPLRTLDDRADPARVVAEDPFEVYDAIEGHALPEWAAATLSGRDMDMGASQRVAAALASAGKDAYPLVLMDAARASRAWPARRRLKLAEGVRDVFTWRAFVDDGRYQEAEALGPKAFSALRDAGVDPSEAELEIAYSDLVANRVSEALDRLVPLEQHARERGYWRIAAKAERLRALAAMLATRVAEAQARYQDALGLAERSGDIELAALFHSFIGEAFELQGDMLSSWSHFAPALHAVPRYRTMRQRFQTLNGAAAAATNAGLYHAALVFAEALLTATRTWNNPEGQINGRLDAARAMAELSLGDRGRKYVDEAAALLPALATRPQAQQQRLAAEIAVRRAFSLAGQDDPAALRAVDEAISFFGQSVRIRLAELLLQRGRIHLRLNEPEAATEDWRRGIAIVEDQRPSLRDELLRVSRTAALWDLYTELLNVSRTDSRLALDIAERAHARELLQSLSAVRAPQTISRADWQRALAGGGQALVYAQLPSRLLIWRVTSSDLELTDQPISALQLRQAADAFLNHLDASPRSAETSRLSRMLLPPGLHYDPAKPLIIVPDGALHRVPFGALVVPGSTKRLVEAAIPIVAPSLTTFALASQPLGRPDQRSIAAIGVSAPVPSRNLPGLPNAEPEAAAVAALYRQRELIVGQSVGKAAVLQAMSEHPVVHFAGHSLLNPLFPSQSELLLTGGEAITAAEIAALKLQPGAIAVLGACDTALGRTFSGEGPMSLVRAFLAAGASSVVAALWAVRDDDATRLLTRLHARLAAGEALASSLAWSQRELIQAGDPPSVWAGFTVIGGDDHERME